jgi:hypothetical protein
MRKADWENELFNGESHVGLVVLRGQGHHRQYPLAPPQ